MINEVLFDPPAGSVGDANCDGVRDASDDEFIEIVNVSSTTVSLAGVALSTGSVIHHVFAPGTTLQPGAPIVVYGGGGVSQCALPLSAQEVTASTGALSLNNGGDTIALNDPAGTLIVQMAYGAVGGDQSITLDPDLNDTDPSITDVGGFVLHTTVPGGRLFTPGTRNDGTAFAVGP